MLHDNKEEFLRVLETTSAQTEFPLLLLEKDYYLTILLSGIHTLSEDLVFKGGTCLNKIYYSYYRLSEDLDFSMQLPDYTVTRSIRRKCIQPVKERIEEYAKQFGMKVDGIKEAGRNVSKQYIYYFIYKSVVQPSNQSIKFEISLRFNPIAKVEKRKVKHKFIHPFTEEPLFDGGEVNCLALNEIVAEKMRAAAIRLAIAPRDFYDLDFILRHGFKLQNPEVMRLFKIKLKEDGGDTDLKKYWINMGRSDDEIAEMKSRIEEELSEVLTHNERKNFDLDKALKRINKAMGD